MHVEFGGEITLEGCPDVATGAGIEWTVYEHSQTTDPIASLMHSDSALTILLSDWQRDVSIGLIVAQRQPRSTALLEQG